MMDTNSDSSSDSDDPSQSNGVLPEPNLQSNDQENYFLLSSASTTELAKSGATGRGDKTEYSSSCGFIESERKEGDIPFGAHATCSNQEYGFICLYNRNMAESVKKGQKLKSTENNQVNPKDESPKIPGVNRVSTGNNLSRRTNEADVVDKAICHNCLDADSCVLFLPCMHLICCQECAEQLNKCLRCHEKVIQKIMVKRA